MFVLIVEMIDKDGTGQSSYAYGPFRSEIVAAQYLDEKRLTGYCCSEILRLESP